MRFHKAEGEPRHTFAVPIYHWERCDGALGLSLWRALRPLLGSSCMVNESYTSDAHVITGVWSRSPEVPILKCESFHRVNSNGDRDAGEHIYYLPVPLESSDAL